MKEIEIFSLIQSAYKARGRVLKWYSNLYIEIKELQKFVYLMFFAKILCLLIHSYTCKDYYKARALPKSSKIKFGVI